MDSQIDFHDGQTFDGWAFENNRLVWWVTYRIARATRGMMGRLVGNLDEL